MRAFLTATRCVASLRGGVTAMAIGLMAGGSAAAETLTDALIGAYNHSGLLEQNRSLLRAADEDVAIAMAALRPIINWSGTVNSSFSRSASASSFGRTVDSDNTAATIAVSAELVLFDSGQSRFAIDAAKETVLATRERLVAVEQNVLLRAVSAYMNVRRTAEIVALRQSNVRVITQELRAAKDRFEVGEITRTDVALAEARLAAARSTLAAAQGDAMRANEEYRAAIGRKPGTLKAPKNLPRTASSVDEAKSIAVRTHPDLKAAQHDVAAADLNVARAEAAVKPTVKAGANVNVTENFGSSSFSRSGNLSVGASGPIYQGGRLSALQRQAMARRDATRSGLHLTRHQIEQNVGNAFAQLRVARASRDASERQIRAARVAFRGVREEASVGSRTTLDVLNAEQELRDAQAGLISVQTDEFIAAYQVLASMGLLTTKRLQLPVQHYDPSAYYNLVKDAPTRSSQGAQLDRVLRALGKN